MGVVGVYLSIDMSIGMSLECVNRVWDGKGTYVYLDDGGGGRDRVRVALVRYVPWVLVLVLASHTADPERGRVQ